MSKKVLILSGSPRKSGNSDLLCDEFMRGAVETISNLATAGFTFSGILYSKPASGLKSLREFFTIPAGYL